MADFSSLLTSPQTALAAGLLAPNPTGSFGGGLLQGLGAYQQAQQAQQSNALNQLRQQQAQLAITEAQQKAENRKASQKFMDEARIRASAFDSPGGEQILPEEMQNLAASMLYQPGMTQQGISLLQSFPSRDSKLLTPEEFQQQMALRRAGRNVTVGGASLSDLLKLTDEEGNTPGSEAIGKSLEELAEEGYMPSTETGRKNIRIERSINTTLDKLEKLADPVFTGKPGVVNRAVQDAYNTWDRLSQDNKDLALYESFSEGSVASLVRGIGEKGSLSEGDINRGLSFIPSTGEGAFGLPDTREVAQGKIKQLRSWFDEHLGNISKDKKQTNKKPVSKMSENELLKGF